MLLAALNMLSGAKSGFCAGIRVLAGTIISLGIPLLLG